MSCIQHSFDCQIDVVCFGFLLALGFRYFDFIVWEVKEIFSIIEEMLSQRKRPKN